MRLLRSSAPDVEKLKRKGQTERLVQALAYEDPVTNRDGQFMDLGTEVRATAAAALADVEVENPTVEEGLVHTLDDPEDSVRIAAIRSLAQRGNPSAIEPLVRAVAIWTDARHAPAREEAVEVLAQIGPPDVPELVASEMLTRPAEVDEADAAALGRLARAAGPGAIDAAVANLISHLYEASAPDRARALLVALAPDSVGPLIAALDDPRARQQAALALGEIGDARAVESLCSLVEKSDDPSTRALAAWSLGEIRSPSGVEALLLATRDDDHGVRTAALEGFDKLGNAGIALAVSALVPGALANGGAPERIEAPPAEPEPEAPSPPPAPPPPAPVRPVQPQRTRPVLRRLLGR